MKSSYLKWILVQDKEFIKLVHGTNIIKRCFKDDCFEPISLEQLQELDQRFINTAEPALSAKG